MSLGRRVAAAGLDYLVILSWVAVIATLGFAARALAPSLMQALFASSLTGELTGFVLLTLPVGLYFVLSEASPSGATWGKRRTGLRVTTVAGDGIGLGRSVARTSVKLVPWELSHFAVWQFSAGPSVPTPLLYVALGVVWALVGANLLCALVTRRRRALYDFAAGTTVVRAARTDP